MDPYKAGKKLAVLDKEARALPDIPTEHENFRTYDYSDVYFEKGTPGVYSKSVPMTAARFTGDNEQLGYLTPAKIDVRGQ